MGIDHVNEEYLWFWQILRNPDDVHIIHKYEEKYFIAVSFWVLCSIIIHYSLTSLFWNNSGIPKFLKLFPHNSLRPNWFQLAEIKTDILLLCKQIV